MGNVKARAAAYMGKTDILWLPKGQLFALKRFSFFFLALSLFKPPVAVGP